MSDEEICAGCKREEPAAQKALYEKFARQMMAVCMRYAGSQDQAKDMMQEGFIKVFQKISTFRGEGPLGGWIAKTMVRTSLDQLRKDKHYDHAVDLQDAEHLLPEHSSVFAEMSAQELTDLIQAMPSGYRVVFNMFAIEGYSHKEIAAELGVTESTSKSQFMKAKAYLRKQLPEEVLSRYGGSR
jgi:RNA polymerase sigma-70 factor (ECF subfamily)